MLREALKRLIEDATLAIVISVDNERSAIECVTKLAPTAIVIDRTDIGVESLGYLLQHQDQMVKIVVLDSRDNKLTVYCRQEEQLATCQNLIKAIGGNYYG